MNPVRRMGIWAGRIGLGRKLAIALAIPALASGVATYLALTGAPPFGPHPSAVLSLLNLDLILLLALGAKSGRNDVAALPAHGCKSDWSCCSA